MVFAIVALVLVGLLLVCTAGEIFAIGDERLDWALPYFFFGVLLLSGLLAGVCTVAALLGYGGRV